MKMSFVPGDLYLTEDAKGFYTVTFRGSVIVKTKAKTAAVAKYDAVREELAVQYPTPELTAQQKEELRRQAALDSMLSHNSLRSELKKKPGKSRTFGD
jgi:hypothetical protein